MKKNNLNINTVLRLGLTLGIFCISLVLTANDRIIIKNLSGKWKFHIGDETEWKSANYNDNSWDEINVPSSWENQGFYGYNGFAWYRKGFTISNEYKPHSLYLYLGYVDDVDEVYLNGKKIGFTGSFPPGYTSAYNSFRKYYIPRDYLNYDGNNTIAIRVYDSQQEGGITRGDIGIFMELDPLPLDIELSGLWKFNTGDKLEWLNPDFDDSNWNELIVPAHWENQGYKDYDGFAWYRKKFYTGSQFQNKELMVVLGKIDDMDEVYLNGKLISPVKTFNGENQWVEPPYDNYNRFRVYYINGNLLKVNGTNTISVRVFDYKRDGGIYEGPIGVVELSKYVNYWRGKNNKW